MFNIVSQQSTARPGCIIELDIITNQVSSISVLLYSLTDINVQFFILIFTLFFFMCSVAQTLSCYMSSKRILFWATNLRKSQKLSYQLFHPEKVQISQLNFFLFTLGYYC